MAKHVVTTIGGAAAVGFGFLIAALGVRARGVDSLSMSQASEIFGGTTHCSVVEDGTYCNAIVTGCKNDSNYKTTTTVGGQKLKGSACYLVSGKSQCATIMIPDLCALP